jgi:hypothetical protein
MNCGKTKVMLALWAGLATTVALLFLLSTLRARAATLAVNRAEERGPDVPRWLEWPAAATSPSSARRADLRGSWTSGDDAEACTIAVATGDSTADGRPVLWKNRDYYTRTDAWQATLFRHEKTGGRFSSDESDDLYGDRFAYVALSDRGDESQEGITETELDPRAGANESGLALVSAEAHTLRNGSQDEKGINNGGLNHWILSRCGTIEEVQQLLTDTNDGGGYDGSYARDTASLIAVIDRLGGAVIFEVDGNSFARQNITKEFTTWDVRPHSSGPPAGGYSGFDYRTNFSRITFTNPISGFPYFVDVCTNTIVGDRVELDCDGIPDGINDLEVGKRVSSVKRWDRVAARMDDGTKDHQYFIQKWMRVGGHPRENYLETVARSVGYAPYLPSSSEHAWTQEKLVGNHLNRFVTVSSVVIVGSKAGDKDLGRLTTMWVALGEPSVAIFVPVFPYAGKPPGVLDDFFLSVNAKRRLVYDYGEDTDGYPVDNIDAESPYSSLRNADHSIDLSALFGGNYYGEGGLQAYNFAIEDWLFKAHSATVGQLREGPITDITPFTLTTRQEEWATWAFEAYVNSDPTIVVSEVNRSFSEDGYISLTHDFTGPTVVEVIAKGSPDSGVWPRMKVWLSDTAGYTTCLTEVGGQTGGDCTIVISPAHATNKAKSVNGDLDGVTSRFVLYRYRTSHTGTADLRVEVISSTATATVDIDKVLLRTEPRSVEMYEVERDWDHLSPTGVDVYRSYVRIGNASGYFDTRHYLWGKALTVEVATERVDGGPPWPEMGLYYSPTAGSLGWKQIGVTVTLNTSYAVHSFYLPVPDFEGEAAFRIHSGNDGNVRVDKLRVKESLPLKSNTAPVGCCAVEFARVAPFGYTPITATAIVTDHDGDAIASYFWDFGDGESYCSGNPVVTHVYTFPNTPARLTLHVTDHRGKTAVIRCCIYLPIVMRDWKPS